MKKPWKFYCAFENYLYILFSLIASNEYEFDCEALLKFGARNRNAAFDTAIAISRTLIGLNSKHMHR